MPKKCMICSIQPLMIFMLHTQQISYLNLSSGASESNAATQLSLLSQEVEGREDSRGQER